MEDASGLITTSGGRYSGGMDVSAAFDLPVIGIPLGWGDSLAQKMSQSPRSSLGLILGIVIVLLLIYAFIFFIWGQVAAYGGFRSGMTAAGLSRGGAGRNNAGFFSELTGANMDLRKEGMANRSADAWASGRESFLNSREQPYYPDVTNRVLRMENREKEAVRALGKINQERLRRAAEDSASTTPLPWGPFWKEWRETHPLDGEPGYGITESFAVAGLDDPSSQLIPNY